MSISAFVPSMSTGAQVRRAFQLDGDFDRSALMKGCRNGNNYRRISNADDKIGLCP